MLTPPPLQNNNGNEAPAKMDNPDDTNNPGTSKTTKERVKILPSAEPMWIAARRHRGMEQKSKLRADYHQNLLDQDVIPGQFLGMDKLARYFIKEGTLPGPLTTLLMEQGRAKTELAIKLLREEQQKEKSLADYYEKVTKDLYQQEDNHDYPQAEALMVSLLNHYRNIEKKRLDSLMKRELSRKPASDADLALLVCKEGDSFAPMPSTSRGNGAPKRQRNPKSQSPPRDRKKKSAASTTATATKGAQAPSRSRESRSQSRGKSPKPRTPTTSKAKASKGKSASNPDKGKGKAKAKASTSKGGRTRNPLESSDLSEGARNILEALTEISKQLKK